MKKVFSLLIALFFVASCGGGGGGDGGGSGGSSTGATTDLFQGLSENVFTGGYRYNGRHVTDTGTGSISNGCGYVGPFSDRATVEENLSRQGGVVTSSSLNEWCATAAGETGCLIRFDKVFVFDSRSSQKNTVELYMTGLITNRMTVIDFDSLTYNSFNGKNEPLAVLKTHSLDASILQGAVLAGGASCSTQQQPTQPKDAIDGNWTGYKATYSLITKNGSTAAATVSCLNQSCTTSDLAGVTFTLSDFSSGTWKTAAGAPKLAGAAISADRQLLSMFVCNAPLDESKTFENCSFFTLKR